MKSVETHPSNDYRKHKRIVVFVSVILPAILGPPLLLADGHSKTESLISFCLWIATSTLIVIWCYFDSLERHQRLPKFFRVATVVFGVITLFYYLIKTRGMKRGVVAMLKASGLVIGAFLLMIVTVAIFSAIFDIPIPE